MARSKNRLFSKFIRQINDDLTIQTTALAEENRVTTSDITSSVQTEVASLVNSAPASLDTLDELAAALGDDANFATTVTNSLADKASIAYVDSAVGAIQGFSGSYDDLTGVPFDLNNSISKIYYNETQPTNILVGDIWFNPSNGKWYKAAENPNNATVDNTLVSSVNTNGYNDIIVYGEGATFVRATPGAAGTRSITFGNPVTIAAWYGLYDYISLTSVTFEDDTVVSGANLGLVNETIVGGIFNQGLKVKTLTFYKNYWSNVNRDFNIIVAGAPVWEEVDPGYSTLDSAAVTGLIDSAYVQARQTDIYRDSAFVTGLIDSAYVSSRVEVGGGGGTLTATAGSALTAGKPVQIKSNGLVEAIQVSTVAANYNQYQLTTSTSNAGFAESSSIFLNSAVKKVIYSTGSKMAVVTDSGTAVTLGSFVSLTNHGQFRLKASPETADTFILLSESGTSTYLSVCTVSGSTITIGTPVAFREDAVGLSDFMFVPGSNTRIVAHSDNNFYIIDVDYDNQTFTTQSTTVFTPIGTPNGSYHYDFDIDPLDPATIVVCYGIVSSEVCYNRVIFGTISGTTITFDTVSIDTASATGPACYGVSVAFTGEEINKIITTVFGTITLHGHRGNISARISLVTDRATGTASHGPNYNITGTQYSPSYIPIHKKHIFINPNDTTSAIITTTHSVGYQTNQKGKINILSIDGLTASITSFYTNPTDYREQNWNSAPTWSTTESGVFYWYDAQDYSGIARIVRGKIALQTSNIRPTDIIGIASATVDSGASIDISLVGSVDTNQTGLTPGLDYYVADDGSLTSTATITNYKIGVAVSSTDLLIQTVSPAYVSYNDLSNKPSIPSIDGLATTTYVDTAVATKLDSAGVLGLVDSDYVSLRAPASLGGATVYDSASLLPLSNNSAGELAYVHATNRLYLWNGLGWYNIALVNANPRFVSITDSDGNITPFALATDGTPTIITLLGADSDGVDVTYSYTKDSDFDGLATITGSGNEYTITPLSEDSATTLSGTVTFKVSDGISFATSVNTFTLSFASYTLATDYNNLTLATQGSGPGGNGPGFVSISADGTSGAIIAYDVLGTSYKMSFSTGYDASTVSFTTQSFANVAHTGGIRGAKFSRDGLHLLVAPTDNLVWHYILGTPYDVTTINSSQSASISGFARARLEWQADGGGIFANLGGTIKHVPLSTPYDITTAGSGTSKFFHAEYRDMFVSDDGTYMLVYENNGGSFRLINMTTAYDISTGTSTLVSDSRWYYIGTNASTYVTTDGLHVLTAEETKTRIYTI